MEAKPELTPGIYRVDTGASNAYLIVEGAGLTIIDTGLSGGKKILALIRSLGRRPEEIGRIVLTHQHPDHVGGAADLVAACGAEVWAHPLDTPAIEGVGKRDGPKGPLGLIFNTLIFPRLRPVKVARPLADGETLPILCGEGGLRVIVTPGHTLGHVTVVSGTHFAPDWGAYSACAISLNSVTRGGIWCGGQYTGSMTGLGWNTRLYNFRLE
jgi:glyoxylase-like metal-dependent hydrolase (beta-lactamase superfamily II)